MLPNVVSDIHEVLVRLLRDSPEGVAQLLRQSSVNLSNVVKAEIYSENVTVLQSAERRVDGVVTFEDDIGQRLAVIVEVQRDKSDHKLYSWPMYVARLRSDTGLPVALLVVCDKDSVAKWAAEPIPLGPPGSVMTPVAIGPSDFPRITPDIAADVAPEVAVISAIFREKKTLDVEALTAFDIAMSTIEPARAADYTEYVLGLVGEAARDYLEDLMSTAALPYHSEFTERLRAEGEARGEAKGEATMLIRVLTARGLTVPQEVHDRVFQITDTVELERLVGRALTIDDAAQLFD